MADLDLLVQTGGPVENALPTIDIMTGLGCIPIDAGAFSGFAEGPANYSKIQNALNQAANADPAYIQPFSIPNRCFVTTTDPFDVPSSVAMVGQGYSLFGSTYLRQARSVTDQYTAGPSFLRINPTSNPMFDLYGFGTVLTGFTAIGCWWKSQTGYDPSPTVGDYRNAGVGDVDFPYFSDTCVKITRRSGAGRNSGHHTIAMGFAFFDKCLKFTHDNYEDHADVCFFPYLMADECRCLGYWENQQSYSHTFGHVYFATPTRQLVLDGLIPASTVFDFQGDSPLYTDSGKSGGRILVEHMVTLGPTTVINTKGVEVNTGSCTITKLNADATCFRTMQPAPNATVPRLYRLLNMETYSGSEFKLDVLSGHFSHGGQNLGTQWYNVNSGGSPIGDLVTGSDSGAQVNLNIFGLSNADRMAYIPNKASIVELIASML